MLAIESAKTSAMDGYASFSSSKFVSCLQARATLAATEPAG
jgi:hypothetical protein